MRGTFPCDLHRGRSSLVEDLLERNLYRIVFILGIGPCVVRVRNGYEALFQGL